MKLNSKKLERGSKILNFLISTILCLFLILLSNRIISDLDTATDYPDRETFENKEVVNRLNEQKDGIYNELNKLEIEKEAINVKVNAAREIYNDEKKSFDNWVETRKTLGTIDKDIEVTNRAQKLDELQLIEQNWRVQANEKEAELSKKRLEESEVYSLLDVENEKTEVIFQKAYTKYELNVFLIRLLFVAPILTLGIFFLLRFRQNKFWSLYFGFVLFSFYAFFFGLVPYLPSYGGYVRYIVGVLLSLGLGYYAIKSIRKYMDQKREELKVSTEERAKKIHVDVADKALDNHFCPSCGKDFIMKKWELDEAYNESQFYKLVSNFCRHCGLELFKKCKTCGNKNFSHLSHCAFCGVKSNINEEDNKDLPT